MIKATFQCPLCGASGARPVPFMNPDGAGSILRSAGYHWRCCKSCGNAFPTEIVSLKEMQDYWDRNRVVINAQDEETIWRGRYREADIWARRTWDIITPYLRRSSGRFLDIACGLGATVKLFQDMGWHAEGVDADPNTRTAHEKLGINVTIGQVEQLEYAERYDVVSIAHAIYFVSDPIGFIRRVHGMLNDDGFFVIVLSDLLSAHSEGGPSYVHTWLPTEESLAITLQQNGFKILLSERQKGSFFVLAAPVIQCAEGKKALPLVKANRIFFMHHTHKLRQILFGKPRRLAAKMAKKIIFAIKRS